MKCHLTNLIVKLMKQVPCNFERHLNPTLRFTQHHYFYLDMERLFSSRKLKLNMTLELILHQIITTP